MSAEQEMKLRQILLLLPMLLMLLLLLLLLLLLSCFLPLPDRKGGRRSTRGKVFFAGN